MRKTDQTARKRSSDMKTVMENERRSKPFVFAVFAMMNRTL
jgi:hypothetical protein